MKPGSRARRANLIAWSVILLASAWVIAQNMGHGAAGSEKPEAQASVSAQGAIMTSLVNGMMAEPWRDAMGPQLSQLTGQVAALASEEDPGSELAAAALLTRLGARDLALEALTGLRDRVASGQVRSDERFDGVLSAAIELVDAAKEPGTRMIPEEACSRVVDAMGPTGRMLVAQARGDRDELARLESAGAAVLMAVAVIGFAAFLLGLAGLALLVVFVVLAVLGRTAGIPLQPGDRNHVYAEVFAVWLVGYMALMRVPAWASARMETLTGGPLPIEAGMGVTLVMTVVAAALAVWWGTRRGLSLRTLAQGVGLRPFTAMDLVWGIACWSMGIVLLAAGVGVTWILSQASGDGPMRASHPIQQMIQGSGGMGLLLSYLLACASAPFFEELFFRGAMYRNLRIGLGRWGGLGSALLAAGISSVVFAAIHPQGLVFIPVLAGLALAFSIMREWRGSINGSIVAHAINNTVVLSLNVIMLRG